VPVRPCLGCAKLIQCGAGKSEPVLLLEPQAQGDEENA
jgi:hypothetical protein